MFVGKNLRIDMFWKAFKVESSALVRGAHSNPESALERTIALKTRIFPFYAVVGFIQHSFKQLYVAAQSPILLETSALLSKVSVGRAPK